MGELTSISILYPSQQTYIYTAQGEKHIYDLIGQTYTAQQEKTYTYSQAGQSFIFRNTGQGFTQKQ